MQLFLLFLSTDLMLTTGNICSAYCSTTRTFSLSFLYLINVKNLWNTPKEINKKMSFLKNLFGHHEAEKAHSQVYGGGSEYGGGFDANGYRDDGQREHQSSFTHEMIAGAAGFAGTFRNMVFSTVF